MDPKQARKFLDHIAGDPLEALYVLAVTTGMRQGELLGLRWSDIDLDARSLTVNRTLVRLGKRYLLEEPKTDRSRRSIPLTDRAVTALREHQKRATSASLVFTREKGSPLPNWWVTREFQRHISEAGLPKQRFHDMRHAAASFLIAAGVDLAMVRDLLGHSTISTTVNIYGHLAAEAKRRAADDMEALLG